MIKRNVKDDTSFVIRSREVLFRQVYLRDEVGFTVGTSLSLSLTSTNALAYRKRFINDFSVYLAKCFHVNQMILIFFLYPRHNQKRKVVEKVKIFSRIASAGANERNVSSLANVYFDALSHVCLSGKSCV